MKAVSALATLVVCLSVGGCLPGTEAVKPVGEPLKKSDLQKMMEGAWIGPNNTEITFKVVDGALPLEMAISIRGGDEKSGKMVRSGTITKLSNGPLVLWMKHPEKDQFYFWRLGPSLTSFIDGAAFLKGDANPVTEHPSFLVLSYPDEMVARKMVIEGTIKGQAAEPTSALGFPVKPGYVLIDDTNIADKLSTKEFWSLEFNWALIRKR